MCVVSMVGDFYQDKFEPFKRYIVDPNPAFTNFPPITRIEFNALKKEVETMKELLKRAKLYDEENGEPNCEMEDKIKFIKEIAKFVGVDLADILKQPDASPGE